MSAIITQAVLLGIGLAMDAFSVSITDGIILKKPKISQALTVALFFGIFQFIMPCIGFFAGTVFSDFIESFDHWVAFILLAFIGGKMIFESLSNDENSESDSNPLKIKTLFILAIATSIDALAVGITFTTLGNPVILTSAIIGIVTFIISFSGVFLGGKCGNFAGNKAEVLGGSILIIIGIKVLIEHLFF